MRSYRVDGHVVENNFRKFPLSRIDENRSAIGSAIFQITWKREGLGRGCANLCE